MPLCAVSRKYRRIKATALAVATLVAVLAVIALVDKKAAAQNPRNQNTQNQNSDRRAGERQTPRYSNRDYGVSFQPPPGWVEDENRNIPEEVLVQYIGPRRADGSRPAINLAVQDSVMALSDQEVDRAVKELYQDMRNGGLEGVKILGQRKTNIAGFDAFQIDLEYLLEDKPIRSRYTYIPVAEHRRTYQLTYADRAEYFDEIAPVAEGAFKSFVPVVSRPPSAQSPLPAAEESGDWTLLLIILGVAALALVLGALYLLFARRRPA